MNWVLYLLGCNPEVQKKVHRELDEVFGTFLLLLHWGCGGVCICGWYCYRYIMSLQVEGDVGTDLVDMLKLSAVRGDGERYWKGV